ncbi:MAG: hypothetical protein LBR78_00015 [Holosporales bacterium]|nr:hypothetical protein [Holosporales bacterium]
MGRMERREERFTALEQRIEKIPTMISGVRGYDLEEMWKISDALGQDGLTGSDHIEITEWAYRQVRTRTGEVIPNSGWIWSEDDSAAWWKIEGKPHLATVVIISFNYEPGGEYVWHYVAHLAATADTEHVQCKTAFIGPGLPPKPRPINRIAIPPLFPCRHLEVAVITTYVEDTTYASRSDSGGLYICLSAHADGDSYMFARLIPPIMEVISKPLDSGAKPDDDTAQGMLDGVPYRAVVGVLDFPTAPPFGPVPV